VDIRRLHRLDHHRYRDELGVSVLALSDDPATRNLILVENPGRYFWRRDLEQVDTPDDGDDAFVRTSRARGRVRLP
jgi:hypothetical protein